MNLANKLGGLTLLTGEEGVGKTSIVAGLLENKELFRKQQKVIVFSSDGRFNSKHLNFPKEYVEFFHVKLPDFDGIDEYELDQLKSKLLSSFKKFFNEDNYQLFIFDDCEILAKDPTFSFKLAKQILSDLDKTSDKKIIVVSRSIGHLQCLFGLKFIPKINTHLLMKNANNYSFVLPDFESSKIKKDEIVFIEKNIPKIYKFTKGYSSEVHPEKKLVSIVGFIKNMLHSYLYSKNKGIERTDVETLHND